MIRSILVPLDGSSLSEKAMPLATSIARVTGANLKLALVVPPGDKNATVNAESFRDYLGLVAWKSRAVEGVPATDEMLHGPIASTLVEYAERISADLVIMSTHGRGAFSRWWLGSVADQFVRQSSLPLLLIRPGDGSTLHDDMPVTRLQRVLVALDGSPSGEVAIDWAIELGRLFTAEYRLLQVVEQMPIIAGEGIVYLPDTAAEFMDAATKRAEANLSTVAARMTSLGLTVTTQVIAGEGPAWAILEAAKTVDLVVMATRGRGSVGRFFLGSVADKVVRACERPVLLVHR